MKFFFPIWEDRIDPDFAFDESASSGHKTLYKDTHFPHEYFKTPFYDGILVSLALFTKKVRLRDGKVRGHDSIRDYFRLSAESSIKLMGDCGAFTYLDAPSLPPELMPPRVVELYQNLGFDYGLSPDHIILDKMSENEKKERYKKNIDNAKDFIRRARGASFVPIGIIHGYDENSFRNAVLHLLEAGYEYIAIGGLVPRPTRTVRGIVEAVMKQVEGKAKVHLLGFLRPALLDDFKKMGVYSFDSASFMRKAWLRSNMNYLDPDGSQWYAAIRIPPLYDPRVRKSILEKGLSLHEAQSMEKKALEAIRAYDSGEISAEEALEAIWQYDQHFLRRYENHERIKAAYLTTLRASPWRRCTCEACRDAGIHVAVFRGSNRNKRRGMHNTFVFYHRILHSHEEKAPHLELQQSETVPSVRSGSGTI